MRTRILFVMLFSLIFTYISCTPVEQVADENPADQSQQISDQQRQNQINMKMSFAQEYYKNKEYTEAIPLYREVIETLDPENHTAYKYLAYSYLKQDDPTMVDSALKVFHTAAQKYPDKSFPFSGLGYVFITTAEYDSAKFYYAEAVKRDSNDDKNILSLARLQVKDGELDEAVTYLESGTKVNPDNQEIWELLGNLYDVRKNNEGLVLVYDNLVRIAPDNPEFLLELGQAYARIGEDAKAEEMLQTYIDKNPSDWMGYNYLGKVKTLQAKYNEAIELFSKAIELNPDNPKIHCDQAQAYVESGKLSSASSCLANARKIDKGYGYANIVEGDIISKQAYNKVSPAGELDYCAKETFQKAYNTYKRVINDERWGNVARARMKTIKDYIPTSEETAAWKHMGKSCD